MMTNILPIVPTAFTFGMRASLHGDAIFLGRGHLVQMYFGCDHDEAEIIAERIEQREILSAGMDIYDCGKGGANHTLRPRFFQFFLHLRAQLTQSRPTLKQLVSFRW